VINRPALPALMAEVRMAKDCLRRARDQLQDTASRTTGGAYAEDQIRRAEVHLAQIPLYLRAIFGELLELPE